MRQSRFHTVRHMIRHMRGWTRCAVPLNSRIWSTLAICSIYAQEVLAQARRGGANLEDGKAPWESSLCGIADWFQGPTVLAVGTIAFGVAGTGFVFGEELSGILRRIINITMGICTAIGGTAFLGWIANLTGATRAACSV